MGIREEVWQAVSEGMGVVVEGGEDMVSRSLYRQRNRIVEALFSILDEYLGEYVGEAEWRAVYDQDQLEDGRDWVLLEADMPEEHLARLHRLKPGDRISIYVRKER